MNKLNFLYALLTLTTPLLCIRIRIPKAHGPRPGPQIFPHPLPNLNPHPYPQSPPDFHNKHPYSLLRTCDPLTQNIQGADMLAMYSQLIYQRIVDVRQEMLIVKHEVSNYNGYAHHKMLYRIQNSSSYSVVFIGMNVRISTYQKMEIISYIQSQEINEIISMMQFIDNRVYKYPCGNLRPQCAQAFIRMASTINSCGSMSPANPLDIMNNGSQYGNQQGGYDQNQYNNNGPHYPGNDMNDSDSPFHEIKANINISDDQGNVFKIGSSRGK